MPQAETTHTTSRRSFLAIAALAGAIVAPKVAAARAHADSELIALGQKMDEHYQRLEATKIRNRPLRQQAELRLEQWKTENPNSTMLQRTDERDRIDTALGIVSIDEMIGQIDPIARDVMAIPAATIVGLAVKARLAKAEISDFWDDPDPEADWDHLLMRKLCDAVIDMAARSAAITAS